MTDPILDRIGLSHFKITELIDIACDAVTTLAFKRLKHNGLQELFYNILIGDGPKQYSCSFIFYNAGDRFPAGLSFAKSGLICKGTRILESLRASICFHNSDSIKALKTIRL